MGSESIAHEAEGDSEAMIVLVKSNYLVKNIESKKRLAS